MTKPLGQRIPEKGFEEADDALDAFVTWVGDLGLALYPAQEEAILELFSGDHVILKTPTGSGKSMVATALHFAAFAQATRSVYTAPIKALVSEKFFALCETFGAEFVGMMTGDASINLDAPIICCTAEILAQQALTGSADYAAVIMDEFHYYGDRDRGRAWQIPLLVMRNAQFLLMSATLGDTTVIEKDLTTKTGKNTAVVDSMVRPVPLEFLYSEHPLHEAIDRLVRSNHAPIYLVHFTQRACAETAQALLSTDFASKEEKARVQAELKGFRFDSPYGAELRRVLLHGIGIHHAGMLPKYRLLTEKLAQKGALKVICGTDTLGVGINVPIRTVLFTQLCKYDGEKVTILSSRDFRQIAGRAGRKGFDDQGLVVAQAPAHVIENKRLEEAVQSGKRNKKKFVRKKPPDWGYKHWDEETFRALIERPPAAMPSRFHLDHGLVIGVLKDATEKGTDGRARLEELIELSHGGQRASERLNTHLDALIASLLGAEIIEMVDGRLAVSGDLQRDFSLHHSLSLFLVEILSALDPADPEYAQNVLTWTEAILENPRVVLNAQASREKGIKIASLKAAGVPYEERMEAIEDITWPQPKAEAVYAAFHAYCGSHPWLAGDDIRPKRVVGELVEHLISFSEYVKDLRLQRSEGVLLRYLTQVYKTLLQNVPKTGHTDELVDVIATLRTMLARVDDSLVTEWEKMLAPAAEEPDAPVVVDISRDTRAFKARVRAEMHALVRALSREDWEEAHASIRHDEDGVWTPDALAKALGPYLEEYGKITFDGRARLSEHTVITEDGRRRWLVRQVLIDDEEDNAWSADGVVDLTNDPNPEGPLVLLQAIGV